MLSKLSWSSDKSNCGTNIDFSVLISSIFVSFVHFFDIYLRITQIVLTFSLPSSCTQNLDKEVSIFYWSKESNRFLINIRLLRHFLDCCLLIVGQVAHEIRRQVNGCSIVEHFVITLLNNGPLLVGM